MWDIQNGLIFGELSVCLSVGLAVGLYFKTSVVLFNVVVHIYRSGGRFYSIPQAL